MKKGVKELLTFNRRLQPNVKGPTTALDECKEIEYMKLVVLCRYKKRLTLQRSLITHRTKANNCERHAFQRDSDEYKICVIY